MNTKFCFLASLALAGSVSITALNPEHADASPAKNIYQVAKNADKIGRIFILVGAVQQNAVLIGGSAVVAGVGGYGVLMMTKK
ncbi:hypothetical protein [Brasilonema sp. UFV-L1]|uniref:hypothetical protein n=1 Tax=Brasilonema sp. UFV-L1 TaxID=2234130 RepID=UPI00145C9D1A|nr:hypothetical protein [Brasilonema sp. UFV-L1]NMG08762.1 hypothetical protein [Brasilonema sp. UFV-L1]